jgi:hypothetical protein
MKYIVIEGDIVNGVEFSGPFETEQAAEDYGERFLVEYIVAPLISKEEAQARRERILR